MSWQLAAWLMLGGSTMLLFLGLPVAFSFLVINLVGAVLYLGGEPGLVQLTRNSVSSLMSFSLTPIPLFVLMGEAVAFIDVLLEFPAAGLAPAGEEWPQFRRLCLDGKLQGNAIPDAWLAAAVSHFGEHLVTFDADFKKLLRRDQLTLLAAA